MVWLRGGIGPSRREEDGESQEGNNSSGVHVAIDGLCTQKEQKELSLNRDNVAPKKRNVSPFSVPFGGSEREKKWPGSAATTWREVTEDQSALHRIHKPTLFPKHCPAGRYQSYD